MRQQRRHATTALIAALGVITALLAPVMACAIGAACPMRSATPHCAIAEGSATCGGASVTSAPPLCCTVEATAPAATLRCAAPIRHDGAGFAAATLDAAANISLSAEPRLAERLQSTPFSPRNALSLNSVLLL